jgi:EAL domain-containing protein (putative c-di-GMP-specific phosphodiesterase class I)
VLHDLNDYSIIGGVIGLAKAFNREVIAEGVEASYPG